MAVTGTSVLVSVWDYELATLIGGFVGFVITLFLIRTEWGLAPVTVSIAPVSCNSDLRRTRRIGARGQRSTIPYCVYVESGERV